MMTSSKITQLLSTLDSSLFKDVPDGLLDGLSQLSELTRQIEEFAPSYDYGDIQHNGCRSLLQIIDRFVPIVKETIVSTDDRLFRPLVEVTNLLLDLCSMVVDLHSSPPALSSSSWHLNNFIATRPQVKEKVKYYWGYFSLFHLEAQSRLALRIFGSASTLFCGFPSSLFTLISRNSYGSRMSDILYHANAFFPLSLLNFVNNPLTSALSSLNSMYHRTSIKKLSIPRQTDWIIPQTGGGRVTFNPNILPESNLVTCRVMSYSGSQASGDIIFHIRGGAFVIDVPQFHDTYLTKWLPQLKGAVILDVDYTRAVRYPVALQEILDLYLWLVTQTTEVTQALGFKPRRIIFCGDSGGAYLLLTLAVVLRDIQKISRESVPIFPSSLVGFYPIFSFNHQGKTPSLIMGFLDAFVNLNTVYQGLSLYASGITFDSDFDHSLAVDEQMDKLITTSDSEITADPCENDTNNNADCKIRYVKDSLWERFYNTWLNSEKNWYSCDKGEFARRREKILADSMTPYISPMVSYDLDLLDDLSIHIIVGEFDPLLDMSLDYAKNWKGKVKIAVVPDLPHGFLNMTHFSDKAHEGANLCLKYLIEALQS